MTSPDRAQPEGAIGIGQFRSWQLMTEADAKAQMSGGVRTSFNNAQNAFKTDGKSLSQQLEMITDHSRTIEEIREELAQLTIFGKTRTFTGNADITASPGTISWDVIMIGAGGGGASGAGTSPQAASLGVAVEVAAGKTTSPFLAACFSTRMAQPRLFPSKWAIQATALPLPTATANLVVVPGSSTWRLAVA